jgi:LruC domain-containing protein
VVNLLSAGVATKNTRMEASIVIPLHLKTLYVLQTDPLSRKTVKVVNIDPNLSMISCNFSANSSTNVSTNSKIAKVISAVSPQASDYTLPASYNTLNASSITLAGNANYYVPAGVTNSLIDFGWVENSALYVACNVVFNKNNFYIPTNCKLVILPGGTVTFNTDGTFEKNGVVVAVHQNATLTLNNKGAIGLGSSLYNDGKVELKDKFEIRSNSVLVNNNQLTATYLQQTNDSRFTNNGNAVLSELIMNARTLLENIGTLTVTKALRTNNLTSVIRNNNLISTAYFDMKNGGGTLENNCKISAEDFAVDMGSVTCASGSIISVQDLYVNSTTITLNGNAILKTTNKNTTESTAVTSGVTFSYNVLINGVATSTDKPLVTVWKLNKTKDWKVLELQGNMEFVLEAGNTPGGNYFKSISSGVSFVEKPTITVAATTCNDGGINADNGSGKPKSPPMPLEVIENNSYTFAMEDLWPNLGDYDMNDFVFTLKNIKKLINSDNKVIKLQFDITARAAGSTKKIAAAVQFDNIAKSNVTLSSTSDIGSIDPNINLANVRLFSDVHSLFGKQSPVVVNTIEKIAPIQTQTYTYTINFNTAVESKEVIISAMNFYVIVGDANVVNRNEIHLAGFAPTTMQTKETNNYKDSNNMIWALMLPTSDFKFPTEKTKIYDAYPSFNSWASSAGKTDTDWYLKPSISSGLVYTKY